MTYLIEEFTRGCSWSTIARFEDSGLAEKEFNLLTTGPNGELRGQYRLRNVKTKWLILEDEHEAEVGRGSMTNYQWPEKLFRSPDGWGDYLFLFTKEELKKAIASLKGASDGFENISESDADVFELEEIGPNGDEALYSPWFVGSPEWMIKVSNSDPDPVVWQEEGLYLTTPNTFHFYDPEEPEDVESFRGGDQ